MFLDMKTVFFSYIISDLVCTVFMVFLWYRNRKRFDGMSLWVVHFVLQVTGLLLILMRGTVPDLFSIVIANALMVGGAFAMFVGLERFVGKQGRQVHNFAFLTAFIVAQAYFTYVQPSLAARVMNFSLGLLVLASQCAWLLFRRVDSVMRPITRGLGIVFVAYCGLSLLRMILILAGPPAEKAFLQSGATETLLIMTYQMFFIVQTYSLAMMVNRRLTGEIQTQEERFRSMVEFTSDWDYWIGPEGRLLYTTPSCEGVTGYGPQEFIDDPELRKNIVHPDDQVAVHDHSDEAASKLVPLSLDCRIITRNGETRWLNHVCGPVYASRGQWLGRVVSNRDITHRKQIEQQLIEAREDWERIFHAVGHFTLILSPMQEILALNRMGEKLLGQAANELIGRRCYEVFHGTSTPPEGCPFAAVSREGKMTTAQMEMEALNRIFMVSCTPVLKDNGTLDKIIHVATDITERKDLEAQLIQAQKMESVGRLAGGVAHDFNNKLSGILGYAELAMAKLDKSNPIYSDLEKVYEAGRQSTKIVQQLLAFARKQTIAPKPMDLNDTVEGMLKMLRRLIGEDIDLKWNPDSDLWLVNMDASQIDQILANLCVNARDAIAGVGEVTVETRNVILEETYSAQHPGFVPGEHVMLAVSDNGCGMDKQTLDNVFEPFFTTKEVDKGTGLGLSTVYGIVKQNNGFINAYSEPGKGTTFRIYLPRHRGDIEKTPDETDEYIPRGNGETILVVEDDPPVLQLAEQILESLGYTVLSSQSPVQAVEIIRNHTGEIQLLMTDVVMPEMNGKDLADQLHGLYPDIKVLFMSGYTADAIAHHGVLDTGMHFIQKPFSMSNLSIKVREALDADKG